MLIIYHTATADYRKCKSKKTTLNLQKIDFVLSKSNFWSRGQYGFNYKNMANLSWSGSGGFPTNWKARNKWLTTYNTSVYWQCKVSGIISSFIFTQETKNNGGQLFFLPVCLFLSCQQQGELKQWKKIMLFQIIQQKEIKYSKLKQSPLCFSLHHLKVVIQMQH